MGCLTVTTPAGRLGTTGLLLCDIAVVRHRVGSAVKVSFTAQSNDNTITPEFSGVIAKMASSGIFYVIDVFPPTSVEVPYIGGGSWGPPATVMLRSQHPLTTDLVSEDLHVSVGLATSFANYSIGSPFLGDPHTMLRTDFTVPKASASESFAIEVGQISQAVSPTVAPSATIDVSNLGTGSGIDAITGVTMDPDTGQLVGGWTTADSPLVPPGGTQPVTLRMTSAPGSQYAGKTLSAIFTDSHGNKAQASFSVTGTGGTTTQPPTTSPSPSLSPGVSPWLIAGGLGIAALGIGALALGSRR